MVLCEPRDILFYCIRLIRFILCGLFLVCVFLLFLFLSIYSKYTYHYHKYKINVVKKTNRKYIAKPIIKKI